MKNLINILFIILLLQACVETPQAPDDGEIAGFSAHGAYILNEGLRGYNNSSLTRIDFDNFNYINNYFSKVNYGLKIGDTANDIIIKGDTAYIAVSSSHTVEMFNIRTGRSAGRIIFDNNVAPRALAIANDSLCFVSDLYNASIIAFNPKSKDIIKTITSGAAPEGITLLNDKIYVCNSGYGDYLQKDPGASTISVIDINRLTVINNFKAGINPTEVDSYKKQNMVVCLYKHLPSKGDSLGGVIAFDEGGNKVKEWRFKHPVELQVSETEDKLFILTENKAYVIELKQMNEPEVIIENNVEGEFYYSLAYNESYRTLWIGNSKDYQKSGEILIYPFQKDTSPLLVFPVGVNPNTILFY